jgi:hypothetical protein
MIDPDDTPHQSNNLKQTSDPKQTSILIDDWVDTPLDSAPRAVPRQLAPLAIVGLGAMAIPPS